MGGAVFTSLDGETNFASLPERVEVALRGALGASADKLGLPHKSDRLLSAEEPSFTRQLLRVSTITRVGNHEVVRVRPFVRVAGNLSLTASDLSASIPAFTQPPTQGSSRGSRSLRAITSSTLSRRMRSSLVSTSLPAFASAAPIKANSSSSSVPTRA